MYLFGADRHELIKYLPRNAVIAEIGVAAGGFSEKILTVCQPKELHLIDPWQYQESAEYQTDAENVPPEIAVARYQNILRVFDEEIRSQRVFVHKCFSHEAAGKFPDRHFDWVFIDGMHSYDACLSDLRLYSDKVKADGFITGHDYANHPAALHSNFGVVEAVNRFISETGFIFAALTCEVYPAYVISKTTQTDRYRDFIASALLNLPVYAEIKNPEKKIYQQVVANFSNGAQKIILSFD